MKEAGTHTPTKKPLSKTLAVDTFSAIASSGLVAPAISIIDQAIFSNASGKETMMVSIRNSLQKLVFSPIQFLKQPQVPLPNM
jgi:hypothetical protein